MNKFIIKTDFSEYIKVFLEENAKLNLISKKDEDFLFEKHIYDSLSIKLFLEKYGCKPSNILDIGTGGGFPLLPIALEYPDIDMYGIDSIRKKITAVSNIVNNLNIKNVTLINDRVENIKDKKFDVIVSRAVSKIDIMIKYAYPLLNEGGFIILYKSKTASDEISEAKDLIRKLHLKIKPIIKYELPLPEKYERNLVILEK